MTFVPDMSELPNLIDLNSFVTRTHKLGGEGGEPTDAISEFDTQITDYRTIDDEMWFEISAKSKKQTEWKPLGYFNTDQCEKHLPHQIYMQYQHYME